MQTAREVDKNGFLTIKGCPISSFGIFDYSAGQVGLPGDPNRIVKVYRPESAVNNPEAINSFKNVPFIDDHEMLSGFEGDEYNTAPEEKGVDGVLTSEVYFDSPWMRGNLKVFSRRLRRAIDSGKVDLSLGYDCDFIVQSGEFNGQPYEVIQTNLRGNHIALVDMGRVPGARVLDGRCFDHLCLTTVTPSNEDKSMALNKQARDNAVEQLKALIPALEQFLNEESTEPAHQEGAAPAAAAPVDASTTEGGEGENQSQAPPAGGEGGGEGSAEVPPANAEQAATAEAAPAADPAAAGGELPQIISQIEALLAKLKGGANDGVPAGMDNDLPSGKAEDVVEGLQEGGHSGSPLEKDDDPTKNPKASPGPAKGEHSMASDSAVSAFYADSARKNSLYQRLSKVVGAFDSATMDSKAVAAYGAKKLGLKCADGAEFDVVDNYLRGVEHGNKVRNENIQTQAADSAATDAGFEAWIKGE